MSVPYLSPGNENASLYSGIDVLNLSRLKRIPPLRVTLFHGLPTTELPLPQAMVGNRQQHAGLGHVA